MADIELAPAVAGRPPRILAAVHSLPCRIAHNGEAPVEQYFASLIEEDSGHLQASFRGHGLRGQQTALPAGFVGVLYKEQRAVYSDHQVCLALWCVSALV